ncbi:hypothetical protein [uncultured Corynebacterium sp.]|uniref:hypothetical protein n=1 Tax=uncultured Corynebacterium sp. TaxID=159447 RepID=UPI00261B2958|nr:hypothetical protein [uncultured Corynebacterium sp.]
MKHAIVSLLTFALIGWGLFLREFNKTKDTDQNGQRGPDGVEYLDESEVTKGLIRTFIAATVLLIILLLIGLFVAYCALKNASSFVHIAKQYFAAAAPYLTLIINGFGLYAAYSTLRQKQFSDEHSRYLEQLKWALAQCQGASDATTRESMIRYLKKLTDLDASQTHIRDEATLINTIQEYLDDLRKSITEEENPTPRALGLIRLNKRKLFRTERRMPK